jgi:predicted AAA+ superfamily ATPase
MAIQLAKDAIEIFELEQKEHLAAATYKYAISVILKNKKFVITILKD